MGSIVLQEARSVGDILDTGNYRFSIGSIPGYLADASLEIQCTQAVYPGSQNETFSQIFPGGHELSYRGRRILPKTLGLNYAETVAMNVTRAFGSWLEYIAGMDSGNSQGYKSSYTVDGATLTIYDIVGAVRDTVTFYGLQPSDRPDVNVDSTSSGAWMVNVTLTYDFYYSTLYGPSGGSAGSSDAISSATSSAPLG